MQKFVVDGYNVIHADAGLKRTAQHDLRAARRGLVNMLNRYLESKRVQLTVVFDGHGGMAEVDVKVPGVLQLVYSPSGQSADDLILAILEESGNPREYVVVTSDMADIGRTARSIGAEVLPSPEFLSRIRSKRRETGGDPGPEEAADVDYWLDRFGGESGEDG